MAFNAALPQNNSPVASAELRGQFNGLKELIDQHPTADEVNSAIVAGSAGNLNNVNYLDLTVSDPPTQQEVQALADRFHELMLNPRRE